MNKIIGLALFLTFTSCYATEPLAPPAMGEETKGVPAVIDEETSTKEQPTAANENSDIKQTKQYGSSKVTEYKRESGQVYRLELEHSERNKQYIEETDSDGRIESTENDIEDTPNLPKWKIREW